MNEERQMTEQKIYFQWQNPALKETIYPRREVMLRHVLEFYKEIDLWAEYKHKQIDELSRDIEEYHANKEQTIKQAWDDYQDLLDYFSDKPLSRKIVDKIN